MPAGSVAFSFLSFFGRVVGPVAHRARRYGSAILGRLNCRAQLCSPCVMPKAAARGNHVETILYDIDMLDYCLDRLRGLWREKGKESNLCLEGSLLHYSSPK